MYAPCTLLRIAAKGQAEMLHRCGRYGQQPIAFNFIHCVDHVFNRIDGLPLWFNAIPFVQPNAFALNQFIDSCVIVFERELIQLHQLCRSHVTFDAPEKF